MRNRIFTLILMLSIASVTGCQAPGEQQKDAGSGVAAQKLQVRPPAVVNRHYSPEVLWSFARLGEFAVSPSGKQVAYTTTRYDLVANQGWSEIYIMPLEGGEPTQLTHFFAQCYNLHWITDNRLSFLSTKDGSGQLYSIRTDGTQLTQCSQEPEGIEGFVISPDGNRILFTSRVQVKPRVADRYPDLPKANAYIVDDLMYRHWNRWDDGTRSHLFLARLEREHLASPVDILKGQPYDTPLPPFDGMEDIAWLPDGSGFIYTCKKLEGKEAAFSTNSDLYLYDIASQQERNLTASNKGYDRVPLPSHDGKRLLWQSMATPGFEADRNRLIIRDLEGGLLEDLTAQLDRNVSNVRLDPSDAVVYYIVTTNGTNQIYQQHLPNGRPEPITSGPYDYQAFELVNAHTLLASRVSMVAPAELYLVDIPTGEAKQLSHLNSDLLAQVDMPTVKGDWIPTTDGKQMLTWVVYPPHFDSTKRYPALLYCEGGPQSAVSQFWSYRWNLALMAAQGYVVVAPNRRGTLSFGQEWTNAISKHHGSQEMKDLLVAIDRYAQKPYVDQDRLGAVGASYGGYTVNWLAGHHDKRFKAFISHCGIFNSEMEYYTTEELFFDQWEMGGAPYERGNAVAQESFAQSPHLFVDKWDTPIMVIHGGNDFRIPYTQGMAAFNAARMRGLEAKFLFFPDECHWVLQPQNGLLWQREFFSWLDKYLKAQ